MSNKQQQEQSIKRRSQKTPEEDSFQTFCKQMLKTRVFKGCYQERRYVEHLNGYRDLIIIDGKENDLIKDLEYIRNRIMNYYQYKNPWIGITLPNMIGTPAGGVCIWTEINDIPLGNHWFYIKSIKFRDNEIELKLQQLRSAENDNDNERNFTRIMKNNTSNPTNENNSNNTTNNDNDTQIINDFIELFISWKNSIRLILLTFLSRDINKENITSTLKFIGLIIISLLTFTIETIKFIGIYSLRFLAELRLWIYTCTPIIIKLFEIISKIIGGFYILIAMLWRDTFGSAIAGGNDRRQNINYNNMLPALQNNYNRPIYKSSTDYYKNLHNNRGNGSYNRKKNF